MAGYQRDLSDTDLKFMNAQFKAPADARCGSSGEDPGECLFIGSMKNPG